MIEPSALTYRAPSDDDLECILSNLRKTDAEVLHLFSIQDIPLHFRNELASAQEGLTIDANERPIGLAGLQLITPPGYDFVVGGFWVVGTEALAGHLNSIVKDLASRWSGLCKVLTACCHVTDVEAQEALSRLGFTPCPTPAEFGEAAHCLVQMMREC